MRRVSVLGGGVAILLLALTLAVASSASATVLCKTATNPCTGGTYAKGTAIEMSLASPVEMEPPFGVIECTGSTINAEVTSAGGESSTVTANLTSFALSSCNCPMTVLQKGSLELHSAGSGNGTVTLNGSEVTTECSGFHCIVKTTITDIGSLAGGEMASLAVNATTPRTGGRSGAFCGSGWPWTARYTITKPEPLFVEESVGTNLSTVLCKTASNPCAGGSYPKGTVIEASLKSGVKSALDPPYGAIECSESLVKGAVTGPGGGGSPVFGTIGTLSFGKCSATVSVLNKGIFTIESPKENNGTFKLEGLETTVEFIGTHCIYSGKLSFSLKGGEMASLATSSTLRRTSGRSGAFCGESAAWTVEYTVTAPEPLYVEEA